MDFSKYDVIVVGAGLSGCVIAERFANIKNKKVLHRPKRKMRQKQIISYKF